jgi:VIT1/CCC1 family predicted Fe2+/Mn2+ transporter
MKPSPRTSGSAAAPRQPPSWRGLLERATLREILMGAQDNLTNVLAVVLGVAIGAGRSDLVALAGSAAAIAEAISMGGVLYTSSRAQRQAERAAGEPAAHGVETRLSPAWSGLTTFGAALVAGLIPLAPFWVLPFSSAAVLSVLISLGVLFGLGALTGRISGGTWWRDGLRLLVVAGLAALAAAAIGATIQVG